MRVTIAGLGRVGSSIADRLSQENCELTVIDSNENAVSHCTSRLDVRGVVGSASSPETLKRAKTEQADLLIAITESDSTNMIACQLAHSLFDVPKKIARVRSDEYHQSAQRSLFSDNNIPVDVLLSPEKLVADVAVHHLTYPSANTAYSLCNNAITLFGFTIGRDVELTELPLSQLTKYYGDMKAIVLALERNGNLIIADGNTTLSSGDTVYVTVESSHAARLMTLFGFERQSPTRIVLAGGGRVGKYVARHILTKHKDLQWLTIIDRNPIHAHQVAAEFEDVLVLHGNILDNEVLNEASIHEAQMMLTLTNDNRDNLIAGVMAKNLGCESAIALVHGKGFSDLIPMVGLDGYIDPLVVTGSEILTHLRRGSLIGVQVIADGKAEVIEAKLNSSSPLINREIKDIDELRGMRIGSIVRDGEVISPFGSMRLLEDDILCLVCPIERKRDAELLLRSRINVS